MPSVRRSGLPTSSTSSQVCARVLMMRSAIMSIAVSRSSGSHPLPPGRRYLTLYALIGDCHGAALVSSAGSIDWCCLPRFDHGSCFARLLDWERGGYCAVEGEGLETRSRYLEGTLVVETELRGRGGVARLLDLMV